MRFRFGFYFDFWRGGLAALMGGVLFFRLESPVEQLLVSVPASPDTWLTVPHSSAAFTSWFEDFWKGQLCLARLSAHLGVLSVWERAHTSGFFLSYFSIFSQW